MVERLIAVAVTVIPLVTLVVWLAGSWWLMSPEPDNPAVPEMTRRAGRALTVASAVLGLAFVATIPFTRDTWTGSLYGQLWLLLAGAHAVLTCWYLASLSARLNATLARKRFRQLAVALPFIVTVQSVSRLALPIPYLDTASGIAGLVLLGWFIIFPLTLRDFATKLLAELCARRDPLPPAMSSPETAEESSP